MPEPYEPEPIDEAAEEAAAAAEAANIGGTVSDYAGPADLPATEAERPLAEAGEGEAEGQEQAELDLERAAESSEGMSDAEHRIDDTIEQAANPLEGETIEEQAGDEPVRGCGAARRVSRWTPPVAPSATESPRRSTPPRPSGDPGGARPSSPSREDEDKDKGDDDERVGLADLVRPLRQPVAVTRPPTARRRARGAA